MSGRWLRPRHLAEALDLLAAGARPLGGGTHIVGSGEIGRGLWCDLGLLGLSGIGQGEDGSLRIGAMTTIADLAASPRTRTLGGGILADMVRRFGPPPLRQAVTVGGRLGREEGSSDLLPVLMALSARVRLLRRGGERVVELGQGGTRLTVAPGELITEVEIPPTRGSSAFFKVARTAVDLSLVNGAVWLEGDRVTVVLGGLTPEPCRLDRTAGEPETAEEMEERLLREVPEPLTDFRASGLYRRHLAAVRTVETLARARERMDAERG